MTITSPETSLTTGTWTVEPVHSEVGFTVRHLGMSKVRGRFRSFRGEVEIAADPMLSTVRAEVDLGSVDTDNEDRDAHLRQSDFFDVEVNPTMTFVSTSVSETELRGDLTLNGRTLPVVLDLEFHGVAVDPYDTTRAGFSASGTINRSDYGIDFNAPLGLDGMLISDKVAIELEIQLVPQS